ARGAMDLIMSGEAGDIPTAAFLGALGPRALGAQELAGFARSLLSRAVRVDLAKTSLVDTCGTGGDGLGSFNFSTAAALAAAGAGAAVAKHGNRAVSSRSGSADVLEALGVSVDVPPETALRCSRETGFAFLFAPRYHPAMKSVAPLRKALGVRTVFNLLGPLVNPAGVRRQVVGVYHLDLLKTYAEVLRELGAERALVVRGSDGMDELTLTGPTSVWHLERGGLREETVSPEDAGLCRADPSSLRGGDAAENARLMEEVLEGKPGPFLEGTLFNAAAALIAAGLAPGWKDGVALARESIRSGKAMAVLSGLRKIAGSEKKDA
ncbi:MAG: anthranilate phosphoribosyltransferase, partial [Elusimicrobiota bacterium]